MSLYSRLTGIANEKTTKIIPENIKKDVQIFDVIGTYQGGGSGPMTQEEYNTCVSLMNNLLGNTPIIEDPYITIINNFNIDNNEALSVANETLGIAEIYTELEYIESSGTQYIDTRISAATQIGFEIDLQVIDTSLEKSFFGARIGDYNRFGLLNWANAFHMTIGNNSIWNYSVDTNRHTCSVKVSANNNYTWTFDSYSGTGTADDGVKVNQNFSLFSNNRDTKGAMRLYSAKLFDSSGNTIRNFIPVKRLADNAVCLYDKVLSTYFENVGTGNFIAGPEKQINE